MTAADRLSAPVARGGFAKVVADGRVIAWRNLKRIPRIPELAIFAIFQSIMFVLLFAFVFGGAILLPGHSDPNAYREYLLPGVFAQTIAFAAATTAVGMCDDINKGIIDRFRSLPMASSAVLIGPDARRRRLQRRDPHRPDAVGSRRRLEGQQRLPVVPGRLRAAPPVRLRDVVDRRLARAVGPDGRGRPAGVVHRHLPADVRLERVRPGRLACRPPPAVRRVEPDQHDHRGVSRVIRATRACRSRPAASRPRTRS